MVAQPGDDVGEDVAGDGRNETVTQRADRNLNELLQEVRVAQTGVQILFAFLLSLPFTQRFSRITAEERVVYLATLLATALATACLIGPVSYHRVLFRQRRKEAIVEAANRLAQIGLAFLGIAVTLSVYLIFQVVAGRPLALVV